MDQRFRVRPGWHGVSVLQRLVDGPAFLGGQVDASIRVLRWRDVPYEQAPETLKVEQQHPCLTCLHFRRETRSVSGAECVAENQWQDFSCRRPA